MQGKLSLLPYGAGRFGFKQVVAPDLPPFARAALAVVEPQHTTGNVGPGCAVRGEFALHVGNHLVFYFLAGDARRGGAVGDVAGGIGGGIVGNMA